MDDMDRALGQRVREVRKKLKMSQADFGSAVSVSADYIGMIERGVKRPSDDLVKTIAQVAGVSHYWLETGEDVQTINVLMRRGNLQPHVNVPLLLSLSMIFDGKTEKELAERLGVSELTVESITRRRMCRVEEEWIPVIEEIAGELPYLALVTDFECLLRFINGAKEKKADRVMQTIFSSFYDREGEVELVWNEKNLDAKNAVDDSCWKFVYVDGNPAVLRDAKDPRQIIDVSKARENICATAKRFLENEDNSSEKMLFVTTSAGVFREMRELTQTRAWTASFEFLFVDLKGMKVKERIVPCLSEE